MDKFGFGLVFTSLVCSLTGCMAAEATRGDDDLGMLHIELSTENDGTTYRLDNAIFLVEGEESSEEVSGDANGVDVELDPGVYTVELQEGWSLVREDDDGDTEVGAILTSDNPQEVFILPGRVELTTFSFLVGSGTLSIGIDVQVPEPELLAAMSEEAAGWGLGCGNERHLYVNYGSTWGSPGCGTLGADALYNSDSEGTYSFDYTNADNFTDIVECMTDGNNDNVTLYVGCVGGGGGGYGWTEEGFGFGSPDLAGAYITEVKLVIEDITISSGSYDISYTWEIWGFPADVPGL